MGPVPVWQGDSGCGAPFPCLWENARHSGCGGRRPLQDAAIWAGMGSRARMEHALSWKGFFAKGLEDSLRSFVAKEWVEGARDVCSEFKAEVSDSVRAVRPEAPEVQEVEDLADLMCDCFVQI